MDDVDQQPPGTYEGHGKTLQEALEDASEHAKNDRKGWYRVVKTEVDVQDSIHEYKVLIGG
jgi:hypothetical protein